MKKIIIPVCISFVIAIAVIFCNYPKNTSVTANTVCAETYTTKAKPTCKSTTSSTVQTTKSTTLPHNTATTIVKVPTTTVVTTSTSDTTKLAVTTGKVTETTTRYITDTTKVVTTVPSTTTTANATVTSTTKIATTVAEPVTTTTTVTATTTTHLAEPVDNNLIKDLENNNRLDYLPWPDNAGDYFGRLHIPSSHISVACYNKLSTDICDAEDSACLARYRQTVALCADHSYQSFRTLPDVKVGDYAYFVTDSGTVRFQCTLACTGNNTGSNITDSNGNIIEGYDMIAYTCMHSTINVHIRAFVIK